MKAKEKTGVIEIRKVKNGYTVDTLTVGVGLMLPYTREQYVFGSLSAALRFIEKHFEGEQDGDGIAPVSKDGD